MRYERKELQCPTVGAYVPLSFMLLVSSDDVSTVAAALQQTLVAQADDSPRGYFRPTSKNLCMRLLVSALFSTLAHGLHALGLQ